MERAKSKSEVAHAQARWADSIKAVLDFIDSLTRLDGWLGALCLAALTTFMIVGMAIRMLSGFLTWLPPDLPIAWEYSSYLMAATFTFGAAMTLRCGGHVRVRLILNRLDASARRALEIGASLAAFAFFAFFTWALLHFTRTSYLFEEKSLASNTPLWIPQAVVTFGILLMCLQCLARAVRASMNLPLETSAFDNGTGLKVKA